MRKKTTTEENRRSRIQKLAVRELDKEGMTQRQKKNFEEEQLKKSKQYRRKQKASLGPEELAAEN